MENETCMGSTCESKLDEAAYTFSSWKLPAPFLLLSKLHALQLYFLHLTPTAESWIAETVWKNCTNRKLTLPKKRGIFKLYVN